LAERAKKLRTKRENSTSLRGSWSIKPQTRVQEDSRRSKLDKQIKKELRERDGD